MKRSSPWRTAAVAGLVVLVAAGCGSPNSPKNTEKASEKAPAADGKFPAAPEKPVTLTVMDSAGGLSVAKPLIEAFGKAHPELISKINYTTTTSPEMPGKLKAQQNAGRVGVDVVLLGPDSLAAGVSQNLFTKLWPDYKDGLPDLENNYLDNAKKLWKNAEGQALIYDTGTYGPLLEYLPDQLPNPPKTAQELLDWAKANPGKFQYASVANSGPGSAFLQGLPYQLGDSDPRDPDKGWDKTWAYLKELDKYVTSYPAKTSETYSNLTNGTVKLVPSTFGWHVQPRADNLIPESATFTVLDDTRFILSGGSVAIPRGVSADHLAVALRLLGFMLEPEQQAMTFDHGYVYPGPAVKGITVDMAPPEMAELNKKYGVPDYDDYIAKYPGADPLPPDVLVAAYDKWNRLIGGK